MHYHKPLVLAVVQNLQKIFIENKYADKVVEQTLKSNPKWGSRDRKFIAETTYGMVRWWRLINQIAIESNNSSNNFYNLFAIWQILKGNELPNWDEFIQFDKTKIIEISNKLKSERKFRESFPDWIDELLSKELGEEVWEKEASSLNIEANVVLRTNTLKTTIDKLQKKLKEQHIETLKLEWNGLSNALVLNQRKNMYSLTEYKNGLFEIQDASSQMVAEFLNPNKGSFVIDACAGAGGKSLHLASLMQNQGQIVSMDIEENKLTELKRRAERAGATIITTQIIKQDTIEKHKNKADFLLLDVPCSGLGTLKRNPDAKWKLSIEFIEKIKKIQQTILNDYSKTLKAGGTMLYATCSILPSENEKQVELFLKNNLEFNLISDKKVLPSSGFDGFYMAKIKKMLSTRN